MTIKPLYIYCIANIDKSGVSFGKGGVENDRGEIFTVNYKDISAVVSEGEIKQYRPTRKNNMRHELTVEKVMSEYSVLPFRFGIVSNNYAAVMKLLEEKYEEFSELLKKNNNKIEMGIKVSHSNMDELLSEIGDSNPKILKLKKEKMDISKNQTMIIEVGKIIEKEVNSIFNDYKYDIFSTISEFANESIINENLSNEMILNAAFLIDKDQESYLDNLLEELDRKYDNKLHFKYVGPFPPYNFVNL